MRGFCKEFTRDDCNFKIDAYEIGTEQKSAEDCQRNCYHDTKEYAIKTKGF